MKSATAPRPALDFGVPPGVVIAKVDPLTGYLAGPYCPVTIQGVFPKETAPTQTCPFHTSAGATIPAAASGEAADADWEAAPDDADSPND
jgi:membrane carboxypeptidase/penicillin-binding protein